MAELKRHMDVLERVSGGGFLPGSANFGAAYKNLICEKL